MNEHETSCSTTAGSTTACSTTGAEAGQAPAATIDTGPVYRPQVDLWEQPDQFVVQLDMPGVAADQIDLEFADGQLSVRGPVAPRQKDGTVWLLHEYGVGQYYRTFQVGQQVDASRIAAEYSQGVLTLRLPKMEAARPRKISVQAG